MSIGALMAGMLQGYTDVHTRNEQRKYKEEQDEKRLSLMSKMHLLDTMGDLMTPDQQGQVIMSALKGYGVKGKDLAQIEEMLKSMPKAQAMQTQVSGQMPQAPQMAEAAPPQEAVPEGKELPLQRTMAPTPSLAQPQLPTTVMGPVPNLTVGQIRAEQQLAIDRKQEEVLEQLKTQREDEQRNKFIKQSQDIMSKYDIKTLADLEKKPQAAFELSLLNPKFAQELRWLLPGAGAALKTSMTPRKFWIPQADGTNKEMYLRPTNRGTYISDETGEEINLRDVPGAIMDTGTARLIQTMVYNPDTKEMEPHWTTLDLSRETDRMRERGKTVGVTDLKPPAPGRSETAGLVMVDTVDEQGRPVKKIVKKVAGAEFHKPVPAPMQRRAEQARLVLKTADRLETLINDIKKRTAGWSWTTRMIEAGKLKAHLLKDPQIRELFTELGTFAALQPGLHEMRGIRAQERFEDKVGLLVDEPDAIMGSLGPIRSLAQDIVDDVQEQQGVTEGTKVPMNATAGDLVVQRNKRTKQYRYSTDGGKTWHKGQPPKQ